MSKGIILVDADDASITVTWSPIGKPGSQYSLQYRPATSSDDDGRDSGGSKLYTSLSTSLSATSARKRNLTGAGHGFWFRVSAATKSKTQVDKSSMDYLTHACRRPFKVLTMKEQSRRIAAPVVRVEATTAAPPVPPTYVAHVSWTPYHGDDAALLQGYKLQMRESDGTASWSTIAKCLSGTEVNKKNLTSQRGYMFRVRPVLRGEAGGSESNLDVSVCEGGNVVAFSAASDVVGARPEKGGPGGAGNSELLRLFDKLPREGLITKGGMGRVSLANAFTNVDLVFLYASAHWCPPCRKYTPQLIKFYNEARRVHRADPARTKAVEIVFVSADHDIEGFKKYFATMPWLAVPFDAEARERIMAWMKVSGVPKLMCLDGRSGKILENNAVGRALDLKRFSKYVK